MIAIVIPYYKKAFFKATLESLTQQTSKEFKVYIGNDGSTENPEDLIKEYSNKLNLKYEKFNENLGHKSLVKHWERCLSLVNNEEWVTILGDDDVYEPKVIEFFYKNIEKISEGEIDVIRYATKKIDENGDTISSVYYHPTIESSLDFFFRNARSSLSEYIFKKDKLLSIGFKEFPLAWYSDKLAVMEIASFGNVFTINSSVVKIRITPLSISGNKNLKTLKNEAKFKYNFYLLKNHSDKFNEIQIKIIKKEINKCYKYNKKKLNWFIKILFLYVFYFRFKDINAFLKDILKQ